MILTDVDITYPIYELKKFCYYNRCNFKVSYDIGVLVTNIFFKPIAFEEIEFIYATYITLNFESYET